MMSAVLSRHTRIAFSKIVIPDFSGSCRHRRLIEYRCVDAAAARHHRQSGIMMLRLRQEGIVDGRNYVDASRKGR